MNLNDLRKLVQEMEDQPGTTPIVLSIEYGMSCNMMVTDVDLTIETIPNFDSDIEDEEMEVIILGGTEDIRYGEM